MKVYGRSKVNLYWTFHLTRYGQLNLTSEYFRKIDPNLAMLLKLNTKY